jgi:monoterpene epsilon-lactone hydrolase
MATRCIVSFSGYAKLRVAYDELEVQMQRVRLVLRGPLREAIGSLARLMSATLRVCVSRMLYGSPRPGWTLNFEIATVFFRAQGRRAFRIAGDGSGIAAARRMIDTLMFRLPHFYQVRIVPERDAPVGGRWFIGEKDGPAVLHFHGGGFVFSPGTTDNLIAAVACAIGGRTFVPDYRLAPEHPFPRQLDDALLSYQWLLSKAGSPSRIVLSGDSSGGHLVLSLLLTLAQKGLPLPAAAVAIAPWTDPGGDSASLRDNAPYDWMDAETMNRMAAWAASGGGDHALFRLTQADLSPLRRVLIHAGDVEICSDMVRDFVMRARAAGADVRYETWPDMNHNFHGFGDELMQSRQALKQIADFVASHTA